MNITEIECGNKEYTRIIEGHPITMNNCIINNKYEWKNISKGMKIETSYSGISFPNIPSNEGMQWATEGEGNISTVYNFLSAVYALSLLYGNWKPTHKIQRLTFL